MARRLRLLGVAASVLVAALLLGFWLGHGPSVRPEDLRLEAVLHQPGHGENLLPGGATAWTLEISLTNQGGGPLWTDGWSFAVTPITGGHTVNAWDFYQGGERSVFAPGSRAPVDDVGNVVPGAAGMNRPAGGAGFVILRDESVRDGVVAAMATEGLNPNRQDWEHVWGFRYHGTEFPARIRFYLSGNGTGMPEGIAVAYTHKERWLGRNLGWTRIFRATPAAGAAEWKPDEVLASAAALLPNKDAVLGRDEFGPGQLGELKFQRGQVLVWRSEPNRLATTATFLKEDGSWIGGSNLTEVVHDPGRPFAGSAELNPVVDRERKVPLWAVFGQVKDPEIAYVLVVIPGETVSKMVPVENGTWVRAHLGEIPGGEVYVEYMTRAFAFTARETVRTGRRPPRP